LIAIVVALWIQRGIWGTLRRVLKLDLFPVRRQLVAVEQRLPPHSSLEA
jgi:hypothetical protein